MAATGTTFGADPFAWLSIVMPNGTLAPDELAIPGATLVPEGIAIPDGTPAADGIVIPDSGPLAPPLKGNIWFTPPGIGMAGGSAEAPAEPGVSGKGETVGALERNPD